MIIKKRSTGSIEDMMKAVKNRIDELTVNSSTSINASDDLLDKIKAKLKSQGIDIDSKQAINYAEGALDLLLHSPDQDVETWWEDTLTNYRSDLRSLPKVNSSTSINASDESKDSAMKMYKNRSDYLQKHSGSDYKYVEDMLSQEFRQFVDSGNNFMDYRPSSELRNTARAHGYKLVKPRSKYHNNYSIEPINASAKTSDDDKTERYIHNLIGDLDAALHESGFENISYDTDKHNIYIVIGDTLEQYEVPFADLKFSFADIDTDVEYIFNAITDKDTVESSTEVDFDESEEGDRWIELESKSVEDTDGFMTEYTLYKQIGEELYICMFGDKEVYPPDVDYADVLFEDYDQAKEWFDTYQTYVD